MKESPLILLRKLGQFCSVVLWSKKGLLWRDKFFPTLEWDQLRKEQKLSEIVTSKCKQQYCQLKVKKFVHGTPVLGRLNYLIPEVVFSRTWLCSFNLPNRSRVDLSTDMRLKAGAIILHWTNYNDNVRAFANWMWHCISQPLSRWPEIFISHTKLHNSTKTPLSVKNIWICRKLCRILMLGSREQITCAWETAGRVNL